MSESERRVSTVTDIIEGLLPRVNAGFDWEVVRQRFDPDPVGNALTLNFTEDDGATLVESVTLGVADGPQLVMCDPDDERFERVGDIVTYQDYGLRVLDPDDPMTPQRARYQHSGVTIETVGNGSRERVWLIGSTMLDLITESIHSDDGGGA